MSSAYEEFLFPPKEGPQVSLAVLPESRPQPLATAHTAWGRDRNLGTVDDKNSRVHYP